MGELSKTGGDSATQGRDRGDTQVDADTAISGPSIQDEQETLDLFSRVAALETFGPAAASMGI